MNAVDVIIVVCCVLAAVIGYHRGAVLSVLSFAGFFLGAVIGAQIAGPISGRFAEGAARVPIALLIVFLCAGAMQGLTGWAGSQLRARMTRSPARAVDAALGTVVSVLVTLLVAWLVATPLASSSSARVASAVQSSHIVEAMDESLPPRARDLYASLRDYLNNSGLPSVFGGLDSSNVSPVEPPDPALQGSPSVAAAQPSVLKVRTIATSCDRAIEGSSFVYAPQHVITNAHVVAGASSVKVVADGDLLSARVVLYDDQRDVAVLYVPNLNAPALPFASSPASTGDNAIVLGYPEDGPFDARSARVRDHQTLRGLDIHEQTTVDRDVYAIRALVRSGNSGGPLLTADGQVLGVVFATALDDDDTGFVLSNAELQAAGIAIASTATQAVSAGTCA